MLGDARERSVIIRAIIGDPREPQRLQASFSPFDLLGFSFLAAVSASITIFAISSRAEEHTLSLANLDLVFRCFSYLVLSAPADLLTSELKANMKMSTKRRIPQMMVRDRFANYVVLLTRQPLAVA